jgi:hypothetical protein
LIKNVWIWERLLGWDGIWPSNNKSDLQVQKNIGKKVKSSLILKKTKVERGKTLYFSLKNNNNEKLKKMFTHFKAHF